MKHVATGGWMVLIFACTGCDAGGGAREFTRFFEFDIVFADEAKSYFYGACEVEEVKDGQWTLTGMDEVDAYVIVLSLGQEEVTEPGAFDASVLTPEVQMLFAWPDPGTKQLLELAVAVEGTLLVERVAYTPEAIIGGSFHGVDFSQECQEGLCTVSLWNGNFVCEVP
jgi:hypothetical protein